MAAGGFIGAPARFVADRFVADRSDSDLPWGTFWVNISGSFLLGLLSGLALRAKLSGALDALTTTGFCGAFTTFSTWSYETVRLLEEGEFLHALANAIGSLVFGLTGAGVGLALGLLG